MPMADPRHSPDVNDHSTAMQPCETEILVAIEIPVEDRDVSGQLS